LLKFISSAK